MSDRHRAEGAPTTEPDEPTTITRSSGGAEPSDGGTAAPVHRRRWLRRTLISLGVLGLVLAVVLGGGFWYLTNRYAGNIARVGDVFAGLDQNTRPEAPVAVGQPAATADPITFLLVGSDTRA